MGRSTLPARTPSSSSAANDIHGREGSSSSSSRVSSNWWLVRLYARFLTFVHVSFGNQESRQPTQREASSDRVSSGSFAPKYPPVNNNKPDVFELLLGYNLKVTDATPAGDACASNSLGCSTSPPAYTQVFCGRNIDNSAESNGHTPTQAVAHSLAVGLSSDTQFVAERQAKDHESGLPSTSRSARGIGLPVFLTIMGGLVTFSIAVLSLNFLVDESTIHTTLRIIGRVFSAIGLVYALAVSLFFALAASTSEDNEYRVKRKRCVQVLLPSVMCSLVGLWKNTPPLKLAQ